ncbi:hypothetical protein HN385_02865 [archaeon]|jgi:hypothetical protein|nr:hypothetical protein [archaeon]MBT3450568.1 hypothetical protein [archaeon]MBT6868422.1 hypothetical protein [archaeon]MBT7193521.1 hypothetical protein [archaeon]MBT7381284.1 hypothetical protein [archaeon]
MESRKFRNKFRLGLSAPFIYGMIVPLAFLDITIEIYHQICFRLYKLPLIKRSSYIKIDRHKLSYLDPLEKINCAYCGYGNGLIAYTSKICSDTETFWCGIKHNKDKNFNEPDHHNKFIEYGDESDLNSKSI